MVFPERQMELQIIEKIPCQYCGRFLTAVELKLDKKADIIKTIVLVMTTEFIRIESKVISKSQKLNKKRDNHKNQNWILYVNKNVNLEK